MPRLPIHLLVLLWMFVVVPASFAQSPQSIETAAGPPLGQPDATSAPEDPESAPPLYLIQPNDLLQVHVYGEPDLTGPVLVRPDGRISLPLVQDLLASGLNPGQLKRKIEAELTRYLTNPTVTVIVEAIQSYEIYVMGQVMNPGVLTNERPLSVLQALAMAGGFQQFANKGDIMIMRTTADGQSIRFPFEYDKVLRNENIEQNMLLESGDVVWVP